jgi:hypothetical protein
MYVFYIRTGIPSLLRELQKHVTYDPEAETNNRLQSGFKSIVSSRSTLIYPFLAIPRQYMFLKSTNSCKRY